MGFMLLYMFLFFSFFQPDAGKFVSFHRVKFWVGNAKQVFSLYIQVVWYVENLNKYPRAPDKKGYLG